jgi:hypothetical protein
MLDARKSTKIGSVARRQIGQDSKKRWRIFEKATHWLSGDWIA